ncbi:MAG TPA: two-component sensor histidine kinase, partial [Archangium sp.]
MALALTGMGTNPGRKSLVFAVVLPLLSVLDVFILSRLSVEALGVRLAWALELVVFAWWFERSSEPRRRLLLLANCVLGTSFYLGLVHVTGNLESPFLNLVPTLPLVVAFVYPEETGVAVASGLVCMLAIVGVLILMPHQSSQALAWASMTGSATFFGAYGSARFREAMAAQNEIQVERARREALEKLALAEHRRAQSEKLATVGRLA